MKLTLDKNYYENIFKGNFLSKKKFKGTGGMCSSIAPKKNIFENKVKKIDIFKSNNNKLNNTIFSKFYERGDLPLYVKFNGAHRKIKWHVDCSTIEYKLYLPIFFEGLREDTEPYKFLAQQGSIELIEQGKNKIKDILPDIILPLKRALDTKKRDLICATLKIIQAILKQDQSIGIALVPFYRNLLPTMNLFITKNKNLLDSIEYDQRKRENVGDLIQETLELLEKTGGEDAYINIKYMVPTYESCIY